ncbi:MAG: hypothetical protein MUD11_09275 [Rhodobacteraceae bacterium]|jgi:hypothetical protein|nr:hypothetical protein [Paracoccaceae bacterium]
MENAEADPKGLIREAFAIEGITLGECRSILVDWALSLGANTTPAMAIPLLLDRYAGASADHPMTVTLRAGLSPAPAPRRRGGRAARVGG